MIMRRLCIILFVLSGNSFGSDSWTIKEFNDEMTGKKSWQASSKKISPKFEIPLPYKNIESNISVACDKESFWVYFYFSDIPSLKAGQTRNGYDVNVIRITWDKDLDKLTIRQEWQSNILSLTNFLIKDVDTNSYAYDTQSLLEETAKKMRQVVDNLKYYRDTQNKIIPKLIKHNELKIELQWHSGENVYFVYPLNGSKNALGKLESYCGHSPWRPSNPDETASYDLDKSLKDRTEQTPSTDIQSSKNHDQARLEAERKAEQAQRNKEFMPIYVPQPRYPSRAERKGKTGYAVVEVIVTEAGSVRDVKLLEEWPENYGFGKSALRAANKLKYNPRVINGLAVEVPDVLYKFTFSGFPDGR